MPMRRALRENGLSFVLVGLFLLSLAGQIVAGQRTYNSDQREHGEAEVSYRAYLGTAHFWEALSENWESEFLQIFGYVLLTAFLYQKGSAESKKLDEPEPVDRDARVKRPRSGAPWPVRRRGIALAIYENSLSLAFLAMFLGSITLHAAAGAGEYNAEQAAHGGGAAVSTMAYAVTSRFWFESLQNWQSEFLALAAVVILSIWLRQRGSAQSKPVDSPHSETGR
jgi:hypothetical protein